MRGRLARLWAGVIVMSFAACAAPPGSVFTSVQESACADPGSDVRARFAASNLGVQQCDGVEAWQVFFVSSDTSSWLELWSPMTTWSSEEAVVYEHRIGQFPGVDAGRPLEWRIDRRRGPRALMFTVSAQEAENPDRRVSRVFVVRLEGYARACVIGREPSADAARALADSGVACEGG